MTLKDFKVGQEVYLLVRPSSNAGRKIAEGSPITAYIQKAYVVTVGRRYITLTRNPPYGRQQKFDAINNFKEVTEYSSDYEGLFLNAEDIYNYLNKEKVWDEIRTLICNCYKSPSELSLTDVQEIRKILSKYK